MKKNTLFHHRKQIRKTFNQSINHSESKDFLRQNPENSAKFSLLQISEEPQRIHNRTFNYLQNHHSRSYSAQFFNNKHITTQNRFESPQSKILIGRNKFPKEQTQQSVTIKSTFSNQMRKTLHNTFNHKLKPFPISQENHQNNRSIPGNDSTKKLRKINYLPFSIEEQKKVENIDHIFKTAPSKQILAILNKTKLTRQIRDYGNNQREKSEEGMSGRKKSIFNIKHLMLKEKNYDDIKAYTNEFSLKRFQSKDSQQPKQLHSTNRNVIKMRFKKRYNKSSSSRR